MCGIAGIIDSRNPVEKDLLKRMTDSIAHRGPDGEGHWINKHRNLGLGHRRLAIIDLSAAGHQPMHFANERYTITYNGEIYNYVEIRRRLMQKGFSFHSESDTEVLLALFHESKEECLQQIDGMFAFAIWDEEEQRLFCARDRFGEKPFYYHHDVGKRFIFASEMKSIFATGLSKETLPYKLYQFYTQTPNPAQGHETFFKGVHKLEAGHFLWVNAHNISIGKTKYYDIDLRVLNQEISESEAKKKLYYLMEQSTVRRLRADVPVGTSLSGGLDSSTIVCLIDKLNASRHLRQKTFSARFPGFEKDEGKFIDLVIAKTQVEAFATTPSETELANDLELLCHHQEEPFYSTSIYAQWCVMRLAKRNNVTVLLDGQGADEILGGYHYYYDTFFRELLLSKPGLYESEVSAFQRITGRRVPKAASPTTKLYRKARGIVGRAIRMTRDWIRPQEPGVHTTHLPFTGEFLAHCFHEQYRISPNLQDLNSHLYYNTRVFGLEQLLHYADRNSMAHSREVRLPFLSHDIVEFAFSLPSTLKIHEGWTKYIQRRAFENLLPTEITWRRDKIGYEPPQDKWLSEPTIAELMREKIQKLVSARIFHERYSETFTNHNVTDNKKWLAFMIGQYAN